VITHTHTKGGILERSGKKNKNYSHVLSLHPHNTKKKNLRPIIPKPDANPKKEPKTKFTNPGHHSQHNSLSLQLKKQNTILTNRSSPKPLPFIFNQHQPNSPITPISTKPNQHNR
jgi:hypothetical protein